MTKPQKRVLVGLPWPCGTRAFPGIDMRLLKTFGEYMPEMQTGIIIATAIRSISTVLSSTAGRAVELIRAFRHQTVIRWPQAMDPFHMSKKK